MKVQVQLFAGLAERANMRVLTIELSTGATVSNLISQVTTEYPSLSSLLPTCFVSLNNEYATSDQVIQEGDDVALLPPVSGGEEERFTVTDKPLSADSLIKVVANPYSGAILTFVGTVREFTHGKRTDSITYEAYAPMAIEKMKLIDQEIQERWPGAQVAMKHRIGDLEIQDIAVIIAVATPHRNESFEAGRYAIERLKQIVPIWKRENWEDGSEWKGHQQGPWNPITQKM
ncbi:molybdenum cofactor biosynthesis protein MoaE [Brevibacillus sp. SYSU BS000544]|uniref:molybdenum cofactor biosynthesis protein MoaE n=1 Tax=Brevibacillus sp. SYSU BS000544 TaxID=3416443 RepID=UPI003CE4972D